MNVFNFTHMTILSCNKEPGIYIHKREMTVTWLLLSSKPTEKVENAGSAS